MTEAHARPTDPATSHEAAEKMQYTDSEKRVYEVLLEAGVPMTSLCVMRYLQEIYKKTGDSFSWSVSPRFAPLERKGFIERCGRKTVLNSSGNIASLQAWQVKK